MRCPFSRNTLSVLALFQIPGSHWTRIRRCCWLNNPVVFWGGKLMYRGMTALGVRCHVGRHSLRERAELAKVLSAAASRIRRMSSGSVESVTCVPKLPLPFLLYFRCPFLHRTTGDTERRYHLRYYKTGICIHETDSKGNCTKNGVHCAFAHGPHDLRSPVYDIR